MKRRYRPCLQLLGLAICVWMVGLMVGVYRTEQIGSNKYGDSDINHQYNSSERTTCTFYGTFQENLMKLENVIFNNSLPWLKNLGFDKAPSQVSSTYPVIVTGADQQFFIKSQGLIKSFHDHISPHYKTAKIIYYDMGLMPEQLGLLYKYCQCEVRKMPYHLLPAHVSDLNNYAFKSVIANLVYKEFGNVWWADTSVRFVTNDLDLPLKYIREHGILFFTYGASLNVAMHTHKQTFAFFNEDPCPYKFFGEIEAGIVAFRKSHVADVTLRKWVECALNIECLKPVGASKVCPNQPQEMKDDLIGICHRFDQSILSVILRRLYHKQNDYPLVETPFRIVEIHRREEIPFFD